MAETFRPYRKLSKRAREVAQFWSTAGLLWWDQRTFMPPKALSFRAGQLAHLSGLAHRRFTARKVGDLISACEQHGFEAGSDEAVNVREWRRLYDRATKVPARLVEKFQRVCSLANEAWRQARERSEFGVFKPHLHKVLELNRQMADCWGYQESPYDALLEEYEPGARTSRLRALFAELRPAIVAVLGPAVERSAAVPGDLLRGNYPIAAQQVFNRRVAEAMGFDFEAGRIDTTTHPFCSGLGPGDCRLATRYNGAVFHAIALRRYARSRPRIV
jgi:carboxypeptidase Taq